MTEVTGYDKTVALECLDQGAWDHPKHTRAIIEAHAALWERIESLSTGGEISMTNTERLSNKELDQAIRTTHDLLMEQHKSASLYIDLRDHLIELLAVQMLRANSDC